jgi:hypothetical protein
MPLPAGRRFPDLDRIPADSRPTVKVHRSPEQMVMPHGVRLPARTGRDATQWCHGCFTTLQSGSQQSVCEQCAPRREAARKKLERVKAYRQVSIEDVATVREALDNFKRVLGNTSIDFNNRGLTRKSVDDIMMESKNLIARVEDLLQTTIREGDIDETSHRLEPVDDFS